MLELLAHFFEALGDAWIGLAGEAERSRGSFWKVILLGAMLAGATGLLLLFVYMTWIFSVWVGLLFGVVAVGVWAPAVYYVSVWIVSQQRRASR